MESDESIIDYYEAYDCNDPNNEPRPDSVVYTPLFQELNSHCQQAVFMVRDVLAASPYQNTATQGLLEEVKKRFKTTTNEQTFFALSGDMAAGKSSVINSILSMGVIARKGAAGGSCTWVVQRFMKPFDGQTSPYTAKVYFFSHEEVRKLIEAHVSKYVQATNTSTSDNPDEEEGEEIKSENYNEIRTVLDTFTSLFCDKLQFETDEAAREYLSKAHTDGTEEIIEELTTWASDLIHQHLEGNEEVTVGQPTPDELLFELQPYTYRLTGDESEGTPAPWPLVKVIDFGLDVPLLRDGIVLVDAPGISDSNKTRVDNAVKHQRQCSHKITVAQIARAKDDKSLREGLAQGFSLRGSGGNTLVLTRGDEMDSDTEVSGSNLEKKRELKLKNEIKALRDEKTKLTQKKRKLPREDQFDIEDEIHDKSALLREKMVEYDTGRLFMRNKAVIKAVQEQYRHLTRDPKTLAAFVVANEAYKQHQAGYAAEDKPTLTVKETGIPALRARIWAVPAEGKLNEALYTANTQIPNLLGFFELYVSKTHMARKTEIEAIIKKPLQQLSDEFSSSLEKLMATVQQTILSPMKADEANWVHAARELCQKWADQYAKRGHLHIMRKQGYQKGNKRNPEVNWNKSLLGLRTHKEKFQEYFKNESFGLGTEYNALFDRLRNLLTAIKYEIKKDSSFNVMALGAFLDAFDHEIATLRETMKICGKNIGRRRNDILQDATTSSPTAYLDQAMSPIYAKVVTIKGTGAPKKRMELFEKEVACMSGIWMKIQDGVEQDFEKLYKDSLDYIHKALDKSFETILHKFNLSCEDTVVKDEKEKLQEEELRDRLKKQLIAAKMLLEGPIRTKAAQCKEYGNVKDSNSLFVGGD